MQNAKELLRHIKEYNGRPIHIMEVCGTHTGAIASLGLRSLLPKNISLVSGPGCPVCVTVSAYIDRLVELAKTKDTEVVTFGDLLRVKGSRESLQDAAAGGAKVRMVYSPFEILQLAKQDTKTTFVFAAVGFETTIPIYSILVDTALREGLCNIRLLTSLKVMPPAIEWICAQNPEIDGFIAPGHVSVITGSNLFAQLAKKTGLPFAIAGFDADQILAAIYTLIQKRGKSEAVNLYKSAVTEKGNRIAQEQIEKYFCAGAGSWRGIGSIADSGLYLKKEYALFDAGSRGLDGDEGQNAGCICGQILIGKAVPRECALFCSGECTPEDPKGACMVSYEGCCNCYKRAGA